MPAQGVASMRHLIQPGQQSLEKHAGTSYIESTLARGGILLKDLGISDHDVSELVSTLRDDDYALIRAAYGKG